MEKYWDRARQLAPHYLAIVLLIIVALSVTEAVYEELTGVMRLLLAVGVAIAYPIVLRRLDLAPEPGRDRPDASASQSNRRRSGATPRRILPARAPSSTYGSLDRRGVASGS